MRGMSRDRDRSNDGASIDGRLYEHQRPRLLAMCAAILGDHIAAEDAVQESFARLAANSHRMDGDPTAYLTTIARNLCRDELRRRSRRPVGPLDDVAEHVHADVEDIAVDRRHLAHLWGALSPGERTLFADSAAGLSLAEMARHRGSSATAVAQRLHRARLRVRKIGYLPALIGASTRELGRSTRCAVSAVGRGWATLTAGRDAEVVAAPILASVVASVLIGSASTPPVAAMPTPTQSASVVATPAVLPRTGPAATERAVGKPLAIRAVTPSTSSPRMDPNRMQAAEPPSLPPAETVTAITPSPTYEHDGTAFAAGSPQPGCDGCTSLYRTTDRGASWRPLLALGFTGSGTILLPTAYPNDPTIFAVQRYTGLLRSDDGGTTFQPAIPGTVDSAAIDPTSPVGDARVYLVNEAAGTLVVYDAAHHAGTPAPLLPADVTRVVAVFTGPGAQAVYVSASGPVTGTALYACAGSSCHRVGPAPGTTPVVSYSFGIDQTLFAAAPEGVSVSRVDGSVASLIRLSTGWSMAAILPAPDYAATHALNVLARDTGGAPALFRSVSGGAFTRQPFAVDSTAMLSRVTILPDGRMLSPLSSGGVVCSTDDGGTWHPAC